MYYYYLIKCDADNSYCVVADYEVIHDPDVLPTVNDNVNFYWGNEKYMGIIMDASDDADKLKELARKFKVKKKLHYDNTSTSPLPDKRSRKPKKSWSFNENENSQVKIDKKVLNDKTDTRQSSKNLKQQVKSLINKKTCALKEAGSKPQASKPDPKTSPSKEELKLLIQEQQKLIASIQSSTSKTKINDSASSSKKVQDKCVGSDDYDDSDEDDNSNEERRVQKDGDNISDESSEGEESQDSDNNSEDLQKTNAVGATLVVDETDHTGSIVDSGTETNENTNPQLYGRNSGEPMVLLKYNIYCKKTAFDDAVDFSRKSATSFLRRLLNGVFKRGAILNCTFSGRPPNAQGKARQSEKFVPLDRIAKKAVIEFSKEYASKSGWLKSSDIELRKAMSQWLGEVKREAKKNHDRNK